MKVVGSVALHYGSDYLDWAIQSIIDHIDELHVLYASVGSHGHRTDLPNPDTREQLYALARDAAGSKLHWHDGEWPYEGAQRDSIHTYAPDADVILVLDADEIWPEKLVSTAIHAATHAGNRAISRWRVPIIHYWRSFHRAILHDPAYPTRIIVPKNPGKDETIVPVWGDDLPDNIDFSDAGQWMDRHAVINHMGYAQRSEIVEYKQHTHGHKGEWRRDCDWFRDRFMANAQHDCHPVGSEYWNPEPVNPLDYLPAWMAEHPFFSLEVIP